MSKPPSWSSREEQLLLLNAYLDNELDASSALHVEQTLAVDPTLRAERDRLMQLRAVLSSHLKSQVASDEFRSRIAGIATKPTGPADRAFAPRAKASLRAAPRWSQLAAAAVLSAVITASGMYGLLRSNPDANEIAAVLAGHQRALLAAAPFDVASNDRHTVKPWFDGKVALSPQVVDLSADGYPLAGGRVEVVDGRPVPVLVYRRNAHVISVAAVPRAGQTVSSEPHLAATRDGYLVLRWHGRDFDYSVVSDVAETELREFVARWRVGAGEK